MPGTQIKVFDKIVGVIELLATSSQPLTLKSVQEALGLNKGTAFRILRTLESHNVAARDGDGAFILGNRVLYWEACYRQNLDLTKLVRPHLERLRDLTSETAAFSILMRKQTVVVDQAISPHATSTRFDIGFSAPLHAGATGRVILAHLDPERRKNLLQAQRLEHVTELTIIDRRRLDRELNKSLARGFAFSEGERLLNTSSLAVPVFGRGEEILGALSVSGPSDRLTHSRCKSIAPMMLREAQLITDRLKRG
ncbi:MAG: IclR family transcriptional regulator [Deltaproteobacteria bacterium]|nr:IclR family transcriptional regulator [Deltaproteobacteria bacterium]